MSPLSTKIAASQPSRCVLRPKLHPNHLLAACIVCSSTPSRLHGREVQWPRLRCVLLNRKTKERSAAGVTRMPMDRASTLWGMEAVRVRVHDGPRGRTTVRGERGGRKQVRALGGANPPFIDTSNGRMCLMQARSLLFSIALFHRPLHPNLIAM